MIIRATATFKIQWPSSTYRNSNDDQEEAIRRLVELSERVGGLARTVLSLNGRSCVKSFGFDAQEGAMVRYAVPDTVSDDQLRAFGNELTKSFYRECGVVVDAEQKRRAANDIDGPLWNLEIQAL